MKKFIVKRNAAGFIQVLVGSVSISGFICGTAYFAYNSVMADIKPGGLRSLASLGLGFTVGSIASIPMPRSDDPPITDSIGMQAGKLWVQFRKSDREKLNNDGLAKGNKEMGNSIENQGKRSGDATGNTSDR